MPDDSPAEGKEVHIQMAYGGEFSVDVVTDSFGKASFELPSIGREAVTLEVRVSLHVFVKFTGSDCHQEMN